MNKIIFIILIVILSGIILYFILKNVKFSDKRDNNIKELNNLNKLQTKLLNDNEKLILQDVKDHIFTFIVNRISRKYKLSNYDISLLHKNFIFVSNNFLKELLQLYSVYELYEIINTDPFNIYNDLLKKQINKNQLLTDQQLAGIEYLLNKLPNIDKTSIVKYIKRNSNIFEIKEISFKNNKPFFSKEQDKILKDFKG